jgi:dihydrofolate reductase
VVRLRVHNFSVSVDGFGAGPDQSLENPLGIGGPSLHEWVFATRFGNQMLGLDGGEEGIDNDFANGGVTGIGATIMGRNMFGPLRGEWRDDEWRGWWGDDPPFHHPVFVLTHHARPPIAMDGGTRFEFIVDGIGAALERASEAAAGQDVRLGGGVRTIQQYLRAGLLDELHVAIVPVLLGRGERLFDNLGGGPKGYTCVEFVSSRSVAHVRFVRDA